MYIVSAGGKAIYSIVLLVVAGIVGYLIYTIVRLRKSGYYELANRMARRSRESFQVLKPCPICGAMLRRGETVHTHVYSKDPEDINRAAGGGTADAGRGPESLEGPTAAGAPGSGRGPRGGGGRSKEALVHMFGCPYCYPANDKHPRICPVCQRELPADGFLYARMFYLQSRRHVHVLGCTECRVGKASGSGY
jgi:hypothetical protein